VSLLRLAIFARKFIIFYLNSWLSWGVAAAYAASSRRTATRRRTEGDTSHHVAIQNANKWSKNFDDRPHRRAIFHEGKVNVTRASRLPCSELQQSRWCRYWLLCCGVGLRSSDSQCFFNGLDNPNNNVHFPWYLDPLSNAWFLWPTWVTIETAYRSVQPFLQGTPLWPTNIHTNRHTTCDICRIYAMQATRPICSRPIAIKN